MDKRIVITGIGVISSIGIGKDEFWKALIAGKSGISEITSFDTSAFPTHRGGEIKNFQPELFMHKRRARTSGRTSQLAVSCARLALFDSGIKSDNLDTEKTGVILGTTMGESAVFQKLNAAWLKDGEQAVDAQSVFYCQANVLSSSVAIELKLKGPNYVIPTACAAGNYAIGYAYDLIKMGKADIMFAGGADGFSKLAFTGFNRLFAIAPEICQPFDKNRKGMMVGEGAGIVILETLESALKRKANIYAEILGYGLSCDAHHMTAPDADGIASAIEKGLYGGGISINDVDYISAHGTGTPANDKAECTAMRKVFGERLKEIPVSSIKSMLGHTMGAASAIEAIACCLALKDGLLPPTINYATLDEDCNIDCVPNLSRRKEIEVALNNASAFGGNNASLALKKFLL
ncbi:MAG: beta-ketoacyl-[acyl-carrier-protein] synthase family protein [Candidatus Omnitrophica bacterium]|jgi:3-oxoacyl-[acyl-carrier-protein] synthase II|nr:beta-ketoacyl-[acyl-carrier-protein] synthase family protein [Candidatus Omnitrophota bacterium]